MLRYLNFGERDYGDRRLSPHRRAGWEFQAVVDGRCAPAFDHRRTPPLFERRLWVFPPGHLHGWVGEPGESCRIVVAHFDAVPKPLQAQAPIERDLTPSQARRVERRLRGLLPDFHKPTNLSPLRFERALLDLTLLALGGTPAERPADYASEKVTQALTWYGEQMDRRPSVDEVARAVFVSPSHLRRLFAKAGTGTPLQEMKRLQLNRAVHLVRGSDQPIEIIGGACGFGSASDFSRVYRQRYGRSPLADRRAHQRVATGSRAAAGK